MSVSRIELESQSACQSAVVTILLCLSSDTGLVGLSLSYALSITGLLSGLISSFTQVETQMVSVERTEEYSTNIPMEPQQDGLEVIHI